MKCRLRSAVPLACLLSIQFSIPGRGQQSYRTSRVFESHTPGLKQAPKTHDSKAQSLRVHRFLGWNEAQREGQEYLRQLVRPHSRTPLPVAKGASVRDAFSIGTRHPWQTSSGTKVLPGLTLRESLPAGFIPTGVATGDFNGDGHLDWVVSNGGDNNLWIYYGRGDGASDLPVILPLRGSSPVSVVSADLRGIGVLDLVVAEADTGTVGVLLGDGDGTFGREAQYGPFLPAGGSSAMIPTSVLTGDFNGDGKIDLVVGLYGYPFAFLPGNGLGGFGRPVYPTAAGANFATVQLAAADLNRDGKLDLLADNQGEIVTVDVYLGNGDGTFTQGQLYTPNGILDLPGFTTGDVNEDGCPDLVTLDSWNHASVFLGNCDGTFKTPGSGFPVGDVGMGAALADVNGDGHLDLIAGGVFGTVGGGLGTVAGNQLCVLFGDGKGTFSNARVYEGDMTMVSLSVADVNGDGHPDVVTANQFDNSVTVFLNDGAGGFGDPQGVNFGYGIGLVNAAFSSPIPVDVNGDGKTDLVLLEGPIYQADPCAFQIAAMLNDGSGKLTDPIRSAGTDCSLSFNDLLMGNFRGTGLPDVLALMYEFSTGTPYLFFVPNAGDGKFGPYTKASLTGQPTMLAAGDFNGDGKLDFVATGCETIVNGCTPTLYFYRGNGDGTFTEGQVLTITTSNGHWPEAIYVGDFNRDGKPDVLVWLYENLVPLADDGLWEFLGNGDGTFASGKLLYQNFQPFTMADVNHDGWLDIISTLDSSADYPNAAPASFSIYLGQPDGTFRLNGTYTPYGGVFSGVPYRVGPFIGDFNGDGNVDIAALQWTGSPPFEAYIQFLAGNGDGTFSPTYDIYPLPGGSSPGIAADMNGDGKTDVIGMAGYSSSVYVEFAAAGPSFQVNLLSDPLLGTTGQGTVTLDAPSAGGTTVSLSASDPAITLPPSVEVSGGSVTRNFQFGIDSSFNALHVFDIAAQSGTDTAVVYGTKSFGAYPLGFFVNLADPNNSVFQGESTLPSVVWVNSVGGYATEVSFGCQGLPAEAACVFSPDSLVLREGGSSSTNLTVTTTSATPPGSYAASVVAQDNSSSYAAPLTLQVFGDFSLSLGSSNQPVTGTGSVSIPVTIAPLEGYIGGVELECENLPSGAYGSFSGNVQQSGSSALQLQISTLNVPAGNYDFSITGISGPFTHSANGQLHVSGWTSSVSPGSGSVQEGQSATFTASATSINGDTEPLTFACVNPPAGITCSFNPPSVTLSANGTASSQLTISTSSTILAALRMTAPPTPPPKWLLLAGLLLAIAFFTAELNRPRGGRRLYRRALLRSGLAGMLLLGCAMIGSCGGGSSPTPTPTPQPQTFSVTVGVSSPTQSQTAGVIALTVT